MGKKNTVSPFTPTIEVEEAKSSGKRKRETVWWKHLVSGGMAGAVAKTATAPIDRVKIFAQVYGPEDFNILKGIKELLDKGGIRSFWRGNGISVMKIIPETATKFLVYEEVKRWLQKEPNQKITLSERLIAGAAAGSASQTLIYPMDVVKTRLALRRTARPLEIMKVIVSSYQKHGLFWFFKGYLVNLTGVLLFASIDMPLYETLKIKYRELLDGEQDKLPVQALLCCGLTSSLAGQLVSYPFAMVTTSIQARSLKKKMSSVTLVSTILKEKMAHNGLRGLYRGLGPAMLKAGPATCISYTVYETVLAFLGTKMT